MHAVAAEFDASEANKSPVGLQARPHSLPVTMQGSLVLSLLAVLLAAANGQAGSCLHNITVTAKNGLQCMACDALNADQCKDNVNVPCLGSEDRCIDFAGRLERL
ncbi:unnamed protein product [Lepidochelys olivacea]